MYNMQSNFTDSPGMSQTTTAGASVGRGFQKTFISTQAPNYESFSNCSWIDLGDEDLNKQIRGVTPNTCVNILVTGNNKELFQNNSKLLERCFVKQITITNCMPYSTLRRILLQHSEVKQITLDINGEKLNHTISNKQNSPTGIDEVTPYHANQVIVFKLNITQANNQCKEILKYFTKQIKLVSVSIFTFSCDCDRKESEPFFYSMLESNQLSIKELRMSTRNENLPIFWRFFYTLPNLSLISIFTNDNTTKGSLDASLFAIAPALEHINISGVCIPEHELWKLYSITELRSIVLCVLSQTRIFNMDKFLLKFRHLMSWNINVIFESTNQCSLTLDKKNLNPFIRDSNYSISSNCILKLI